MIPIREETDKLLDDIEQFAQRKLQYRSEIFTLIALAISHHQKNIFEDIIFLAKFLWSSYNLLQRIGPADEGYPKLSAEFRDSLEKFSTLIKTLVKESPDELKEKFKITFFTLSRESMNNLIRLSYELSWLKNYSIDTKKSIL